MPHRLRQTLSRHDHYLLCKRPPHSRFTTSILASPFESIKPPCHCHLTLILVASHHIFHHVVEALQCHHQPRECHAQPSMLHIINYIRNLQKNPKIANSIDARS
ncbi:hypothetical protein VIGAN_11082900, partial [Vigna angularis var. angularis]